MIKSDSTINVFKAFVEAQKEFPTLPKDKDGYNYKYTELDTVISSIRPILNTHGLGFSQMLSENELETIIIHGATGEYFGASVLLPNIALAKTNEAQNLGAAITYMKRYALCAILGITSDEDVDAMQKLSPVQTKPQTQAPKPQQKEQSKSQTQNQQLPEAIKTLLDTRTENGERIFPIDYDKTVLGWMKSRSEQQIITYLEGEISKVVAPMGLF